MLKIQSRILSNAYQFHLQYMYIQPPDLSRLSTCFHMDSLTLISTSVYPGWKCNPRDTCSFFINNVVGNGLAKKMKVAVKGGAAVDPESGSGQH